MSNFSIRVKTLFIAGVICLFGAPVSKAAVSSMGLLRTGYASDGATTTFNYSPTLVQTTEGLLVAWIGASGVESPDASV